MRCVNEAQIYKYLSKPWEPEMLRLTVVRALESLDLSRQKQLVTDASANTSAMPWWSRSWPTRPGCAWAASAKP